MTKILFINPQSTNRDALPIPPLGILYLAAYLRKKEFKNLSVLDNNIYRHSLDDLDSIIREFDVICATGTTSQYKEAIKISYIANRHKKLCIYGGPHASALPADSMYESKFDVVVVGEGERTLHEVLTSNMDFCGIKGIYHRINGNIYKNERREYIENLDQLPFPARDLISINLYGNKELKRFDGSYTHMISGRGCGSACVFCSSPRMWGRGRLLSAPRVFEEMNEIYNKYGIRNIHFQDDNFTMSKKRTMELCKLMADSGIGFKWSCQTRPTCVDDGVLGAMKNAGCVQIEFGVESGDEGILKRAKKGYTKQQIKQGFDLARKHNLPTYGFFLIGLPGETIWTWIKSIIFARQLKLTSCVWTILVPFPGTQVFTNKMVKILDADYTNWLYKRPIIQSGWFGPRILKSMRWIADKLTNGWFNRGTYK